MLPLLGDRSFGGREVLASKDAEERKDSAQLARMLYNGFMTATGKEKHLTETSETGAEQHPRMIYKVMFAIALFLVDFAFMAWVDWRARNYYTCDFLDLVSGPFGSLLELTWHGFCNGISGLAFVVPALLFGFRLKGPIAYFLIWLGISAWFAYGYIRVFQYM